MMYKVKHVPSGLYYQPHKYRGSNLSTRGKVYQTNTHGLSEAFSRAERTPNNKMAQRFSVYVQEDSVIHKKFRDQFQWETIGYELRGQLKAYTKVTDWVVESIQ